MAKNSCKVSAAASNLVLSRWTLHLFLASLLQDLVLSLTSHTLSSIDSLSHPSSTIVLLVTCTQDL